MRFIKQSVQGCDDMTPMVVMNAMDVMVTKD